VPAAQLEPMVQDHLEQVKVLSSVQVFQKEQPRGLLGIIEFACATGVLPEDVVDVSEGLFKHRYLLFFSCINDEYLVFCAALGKQSSDLGNTNIVLRICSIDRNNRLFANLGRSL
jgi:hypothetical protein